MTEDIQCSGNENQLEKCRTIYTSRHNDECDIKSSVVSITCIHDSFAECEGRYDVPWGGKCYSLHPKRSSFEDAKQICDAKGGKKLVEINAQEENDLLSELLMRHKYSGGKFSDVWTGGKAIRFRRASTYYWDGSSTNIGIISRCNGILITPL